MVSEEEEHEEQFRDMMIELLLFISLNGVARPSHKKDTVIYRYSESTLANWIDFIQKMNRTYDDYLSTDASRATTSGCARAKKSEGAGKS